MRAARISLIACVVCLGLSGCATTLLDDYDHQASLAYRIDNPDRDNLWDTSDTNGNGIIDEGETAGPVFDLAKLPREQSIFAASNIAPPLRTPATNFGSSTSSLSAYTYSSGNASFEGDNNEPGELRPYTETYGMQFSRTHLFKPKQRRDSSYATSEFEVAYGVRYLRLREYFGLETIDGLLGRTQLNTGYDNEVVGPQLAVDWNIELAGIGFQLGSNVMVGYNLATAEQFVSFGEDSVPSQPDLPLYFSLRPNSSTKKSNDISILPELHATASYELSRMMTFRFGYAAVYLTELRHPDEAIEFSLPNFGIRDSGTSDAWLDGLHASVEWRR